MLFSLQKGITTPADWSNVIVLTFFNPPTSNLPHPNLPIAHPTNSCRSDTIAASGFSVGAGIEQIRKVFGSRSSDAHQISNSAQPTNAEDKDPDHRSRKG